MTTDSNGHTWTVDEDGVCEYDTGYLCACGARKVVMAEGDSRLDDKAGNPCPNRYESCRMTSWVNWCPCHGWCL